MLDQKFLRFEKLIQMRAETPRVTDIYIELHCSSVRTNLWDFSCHILGFELLLGSEILKSVTFSSSKFLIQKS